MLHVAMLNVLSAKT